MKIKGHWIAIGAIWIGTGLSAMAGDIVGFVAIFATLSTFMVLAKAD